MSLPAGSPSPSKESQNSSGRNTSNSKVRKVRKNSLKRQAQPPNLVPVSRARKTLEKMPTHSTKP